MASTGISSAHVPARPHFVAHNVYHIGLWFAILFGGLALIMMLRQQGFALTSRYELQAALDDAAEKFENGRLTEAQRRVIGVLEARPDLAMHVVDKLGPRILGMPKAYEAVSSQLALEAHSVTDSQVNEARIRALLTLGQTAEAQKELEALVQAHPRERIAQLWLARILLERGEIARARGSFESYWSGRSKERQTRATEILDEAIGDSAKIRDARVDRLAEAFERMSWVGLWDEAANSIKSLPDGSKSEGFDFYEALLKDARGETQAAAEMYRRVLQQRPAHYLCALRLAQIEKLPG